VNDRADMVASHLTTRSMRFASWADWAVPVDVAKIQRDMIRAEGGLPRPRDPCRAAMRMARCAPGGLEEAEPGAGAWPAGAAERRRLDPVRLNSAPVMSRLLSCPGRCLTSQSHHMAYRGR
jgi:hypothetical protein